MHEITTNRITQRSETTTGYYSAQRCWPSHPAYAHAGFKCHDSASSRAWKTWESPINFDAVRHGDKFNRPLCVGGALVAKKASNGLLFH